GHCDGGRRWWRRDDCTSCAAAQHPCSRREKSNEGNSRLPESFSVASRKGPHAQRKAGEGPAKKPGVIQGLGTMKLSGFVRRGREMSTLRFQSGFLLSGRRARKGCKDSL